MTIDCPSNDAESAALVADFERRARRVETPCGEGTIVWRSWGNSGPPVVLFHGAQGAWSHWIRNIDALARDRTVWTADLPGCGDSAMPPTEDHPGISSVLATGLRQLFPNTPVDIVGFSLGGVIGANLAALHPDVVRRVVLVDTGGLATPQGHLKLKRVRGLVGEERRTVLRNNLLALMIANPANVDELAMHLQVTNGFKTRIEVVTLVVPDKLLVALPNVKAQVDAIWASDDQPHPSPEVQAAVIRQSHPDIDMRVIDGAGHWVMYEQAEAFNRELRDLLSRPLRK